MADYRQQQEAEEARYAESLALYEKAAQCGVFTADDLAHLRRELGIARG